MLPPIEWSDFRRRVRDEHAAGWLTHAQHAVLVAIADLAAAGDDTPTVAVIGLWARCSPRTVRRARAVAEARGLLEVEEQHEPAPEGSGRRQWQTANRYALRVPDGPVTLRVRIRRGGQIGRGSGRKKEERGFPRPQVDLLAARRAVMEGRMRAARDQPWGSFSTR